MFHSDFIYTVKFTCTSVLVQFIGYTLVTIYMFEYFYSKTYQKHNNSNLFYFGTTLYNFGRFLRPSSGV